MADKKMWQSVQKSILGFLSFQVIMIMYFNVTLSKSSIEFNSGRYVFEAAFLQNFTLKIIKLLH